MKLHKRTINSLMNSALAFILPCVGFLCVMLIRGFIPFGDTSMLFSDACHQYYPFFLSFRRALLSGDSLLWNWELGMGSDYLGLIAYYLASPLNLLSVFIGEKYVLAYFSLLPAIKLGFAGLFFSFFLKKTFKKNDLSVVLFSCFYALCAWSLGYQWNIMWLDTFALLPLVISGELALLSRGKFILYTLSLCLSILFNYYIGLFTCIFVALIFICYQVCQWRNWRSFFIDLGRMALYSCLAIGMTAFLTLPAFAALQKTYSAVNSFPSGFQLNIADQNTWSGLWDAMRQVAGNTNGGLIPTMREGLPNLYSGVFANIFAVLFLTSRQIRVREKLCAAFLVLLFWLSFIIRQLDFIWHGFHFTNMLPYRFSFLHSFVVLYMACRAYLQRRSFRLWQVLTALGIALGISLCSDSAWDPARALIYWTYNGIFLLLYSGVLLYPCLTKQLAKERTQQYTQAEKRRDRRQISSILILVLLVMESVLNLVNFGANYLGFEVTDYPEGSEHSASILRYMKERSNHELFYRAEVTHPQILNEGALNGYNGISHFSSSANVRITRFMQALGFGAWDSFNRYVYEETSPVANLFLGLRYMLERQGRVEENAYFDEVHHFGNVYLLENNAYLPLGFLADEQLETIDFSGEDNIFRFQNKLIQAASGTTDDVWAQISGKHLLLSATDVTLDYQAPGGYCEFHTGADTGGTIVYKYVVYQEGLACIEIDMSGSQHFSVWKNGIQVHDLEFSLPQTVSVAQVLPGDTIEVHLTCYENVQGKASVRAAVLDEEKFRTAYEALAQSTLELTTFKNTKILASIDCHSDGILYTSIPQDGNWAAYVDGERVETDLIGNAMMALPLAEGAHTIYFVYRNNDFTAGCIVSIIAVTMFLVLIIRYAKKRKTGL